MKRLAVASVILLLAAVSCCDEGGWPAGIETWKFRVPVKATAELGQLDFIDIVKGRDGAFSTDWNGQSVWVFGDTILAAAGEDGTAWRSSTWCSTADIDASDGLADLTEPVDSLGAPYEFLPFTEAEAEFNNAHRGDDCDAGNDCGARYALWPGPIVTLPDGTAAIMYTKLLARPGAWNFEVLGTSIATWAAPDQAVVRPMVSTNDSGDPLQLFGADEPNMTAAATVFDGYLYVYAVQDAWLAQPCIVGRSPLADILKRDAWRFLDADGKWVPDWRDAVQVIDGSSQMTIHFSRYFNRFVATHSSVLSPDVVMQVADNPWGPWSTQTVLFAGISPEDPDSWNYGGVAHPEFAEEDGRVEYVTYYRPGDWSGEVRLVRVEFE